MSKLSPRNRKLLKKYGDTVKPIPGFKAELIPFQATCVNWGEDVLSRPPHSIMIADKQGLGKTVEAIAISMRLRPQINRCIVVCPPPAVEEWSRMIKEFTVASYVGVHGRHSLDSRTFYTVINHALLPRVFSQFLEEIKYGMVIIDETHNFKSEDAQRTRALMGIKAKYKIGMSGTPLLNRTDELWTILNYLDPKTWGTYDEFVYEYCKFRRQKIFFKRGRRLIEHWVDKFEKSKNVKKLRKNLKKIFIRRKKNEVSDILPIQHQTLYVNLSSEQNKAYKKIVKNLKTTIKKVRKDGVTVKKATLVRNKFLRLRMLCQTTYCLNDKDSSIKLDTLEELLTTTITAPTKVIVATPFKLAAEAIYKRLRSIKTARINPVLVMGGISEDKVTERKMKFRNNKRCRAYIGTIDKNRECINLPEADYVIFIGEDVVPGYNEQMADRAHRIVGRNPDVALTVIRIIIRDSIETRIEEEILKPKEEMVDEVIDAINGGKVTKAVNTIDMVAKLIGA